jgi:hypothetical protein
MEGPNGRYVYQKERYTVDSTEFQNLFSIGRNSSLQQWKGVANILGVIFDEKDCNHCSILQKIDDWLKEKDIEDIREQIQHTMIQTLSGQSPTHGVSNNPYTCFFGSCHKVLSSSQGFTSHLHSHFAQTYPCYQCKRTFFTAEEREQHSISTEHRESLKQRRSNQISDQLVQTTINFGDSTELNGSTVGIPEETLHEIGVLFDGESIEDLEVEEEPIIYEQFQSEDSDEEVDSDSDSDSTEDTSTATLQNKIELLQKLLSFKPTNVHSINVEEAIHQLQQIASNPYYPYKNAVTKKFADLVSKLCATNKLILIVYQTSTIGNSSKGYLTVSFGRNNS